MPPAPPTPPLPPRPTIVPLLTNSIPLGQEPLIVKPGVPTVSEVITTPPLIVATTFILWFHPAFTASVRRFALVCEDVIENANVLLFPYPSDMEIAPLATPKRPRTAALPMLMEAVPALPNSTLTWLRDMAPDAGNAILNSFQRFNFCSEFFDTLN